jgi:hypothetical protein
VFVIGLITRLLQVLIVPAALFVSLAMFVFLDHFWIGAETTDAARSTSRKLARQREGSVVGRAFQPAAPGLANHA